MGEYLPGNLQERLRELREANGYKTREKLAEAIGVYKTTYSRIENGYKNERTLCLCLMK
ncbi:MAG: helix-turn-helix transcriptional regulator [Butyrivibrio sp.]|nr:helix-turn-helix transcriptional regulator [Butyrivibrio sp.]